MENDNIQGDYQTRSEVNGLEFFETFKEAMKHAETDRTVWKISFGDGDNRVRLVRDAVGNFVYEPLLTDVDLRLVKQRGMGNNCHKCKFVHVPCPGDVLCSKACVDHDDPPERVPDICICDDFVKKGD